MGRDAVKKRKQDVQELNLGCLILFNGVYRHANIKPSLDININQNLLTAE